MPYLEPFSLGCLDKLAFEFLRYIDRSVAVFTHN